MSLPSPISVSSWDVGPSDPCLEGNLPGKSPDSHCASPWKLGAESLLPELREGGLSVRSSSLRGACGCHQSLPPPLSPSSALSCPVSPAQSSRQIPAMLGDHDSKFLLLHPSVFFVPLSCIPPQPLTFPNFSHLSFSSQNTPRGFSLLQFVLFSAILDHPGPPAPAPLPHSE